jgi:tetratricopeptide (TPR) repeat protein
MTRGLTAPNWSAIASRRSSLALGVWGALGVGKTFTVQSWLQAAPIGSVRIAANASIQAALEASGLRLETPVWALRRLEQANRGEVIDPNAIAEAIAALLAQVAPMALFVDDLQAASATRLELFAALARDIRRTRGVALIVASRSLPPESFEAVRLEPLKKPETTALLETTARGALPPEALHWIWSRAHGNPLFSLEYFQFLTRQGSLWSDGTRWRWRTPQDHRLPTSLDGLLARVLERASGADATRAALEALSVLPSGVSAGLWSSTAGVTLTELEVIGSELEHHGVLRGGDFAHPLYREVMLTQVSIRRRREMARRALEVLDGFPAKDLEPALIAAELVEMAQIEPSEVVRRLREAAEHVSRRGESRRAARLIARAADHARGQERAELALKAAEGLRRTDLNEALRLAEIAHAERPDDPEATLLCAELLALSGQVGAAERRIEQGLIETVAQADVLERAWWPRLIALRTQQLGFEGVLELWRAHPERHANAPALVRRDVAWALMQFGEFEAARGLLESALESAETPHERALVTAARAYLATLEGDPAMAERLAGIASGALERLDAPRDLARAIELRAEALEHLGRFVDAAAESERAIRLRNDLGDGWGVSRAQLRLSSALIELTQFERAEELLLESRQLPERADAHDSLIIWDCQLSHLYLEWDAPHARTLALRHANAALELVARGTTPVLENMALAQAALAEARYGDPERALVLAERALEIARAIGQADHAAIEMSAQAAALEALSRSDEALVAYRTAESMLRSAGLVGAERAALEVDRLTGDQEAAARRLAGFESRDHLHAASIARRYFPTLEQRPVQSENTVPDTVFATLRNTVQDGVELLVLGPVRLRQNGRELRWHSSQGRAFLARLLEARMVGRTEVPDLDLWDAFWPELDESKARLSAKNLVYRLREKLGPNVITRTANGYALGAVGTDAERFLLEPNADLWRGPYLQDVGEGWEPGVRTALLEVLKAHLTALLERDPRAAVRPAHILTELEPYDRDALEILCLALRGSGNRRDLKRAYQSGRARLLEVGETLPELWTGFLSA